MALHRNLFPPHRRPEQRSCSPQAAWLFVLWFLAGAVLPGFSAGEPAAKVPAVPVAPAPAAVAAPVPAAAVPAATQAVAAKAPGKKGKAALVPPAPDQPPPPDLVDLLRQEIQIKLDEQAKAGVAIKQELDGLAEQAHANSKSIEEVQQLQQQLKQDMAGKFEDQAKRNAAFQEALDSLGQETRTNAKAIAELKDKLEKNAVLVYEHLARGMARAEAFEQVLARLEQVEGRLGIHNKRPAAFNAPPPGSREPQAASPMPGAIPAAAPPAELAQARPGQTPASSGPMTAQQASGRAADSGRREGLPVEGERGRLAALPLLLIVALGFGLVEMSWLEAWALPQAMLRNLLLVSVAVLAYVAAGYGLMFGALDFGADGQPIDFDAIETFRVYQIGLVLVGAVLVASILSDRLSLPGYAWLALWFGGFAYPLLGRWVWGGGWLEELGFIDFAGASVVHAFAAWFAVGWLWRFPVVRRYGDAPAASDPRAKRVKSLVLPGAFLVWLGWFGVVLGGPDSGGLPAPDLMLNILLAGSAALLAVFGSLLARPGMLDAGSAFGRIAAGTMAGLVAVSAGMHRFEPAEAVCIGVLAGLVQPLAFRALAAKWLSQDHAAAEWIAAHGVGGVLGALGVALLGEGGLFTAPAFGLLGIQALGVAVTLVLGVLVGGLGAFLYQGLAKLNAFRLAIAPGTGKGQP